MPPDARPPGPRGGFSGVTNLIQWRTRGMAFLADVASTYGDLTWFEIDGYPIYMLNHPSLVGRVLVDDYERLRKPQALEISNRGYWGDGLTSAGGAEWQRRKRMLQPRFRHKEITRWGEAITDATTRMLDGWSPGQEIELYRALVDLRAEIAARTVVGSAPIDPDEARGHTFVLPNEDGLAVYAGMRRPRAGPQPSQLLRIIDERFDAPFGDDMVSTIVRAREGEDRPLSRAELRDEILQMFFAGHLTIPTWSTRSWLALWAFPELDARVHREAWDLLGGRAPTADDLPRLPLGRRLIQETGRFFPPAPILYREVDEPFVIDGYRLERDAGLWICPQLLHHDPRFFPEPGRFDPDRFDSDADPPIPRFAYLPFGAGPRTCIGRMASLLEMHLVLTTICQRFRLLPSPAPPSRDLLAMPDPSTLKVRLEARPASGPGSPP